MPSPHYAIILAGGYGTRFWPASRRARPKQFLALAGKESLLQQTWRRIAKLFPPERIFVVGNAGHKKLLRRQLPAVTPSRLLLEPMGRNTTTAIALAVVHIRRALLKKQTDAVLAVFPADHAIQDELAFRRVTRAALQTAAAEDIMVVLGIPPTEPNTGYGYIERGFVVKRADGLPIYAVRRFTEKPSARTATRYLRTGRYYWNSGMFFWRLSYFEEIMARHQSTTLAALRLAANAQRSGYAARLGKAYARLENISVDYALAEPVAADGNGRVLAAEIGWSDLGSWSAIYDWFLTQPEHRAGSNVTAGPCLLMDSSGNLIHSEGKFVAAIGVHDLIVVETPDALLLCPRDRAQEVGKIVEYLRKEKQRGLL